VQGECAEVDNKRDCEALSIKMVSKGRYARWRMPANATARCFIPSVGSILSRGGARGAAEVFAGNTRAAEMLFAHGADEERAAALDAAVAAVEDAARTATLMSERGVGGLQQLYSTLNSVLDDEFNE
jgi:hypothetical protein